MQNRAHSLLETVGVGLRVTVPPVRLDRLGQLTTNLPERGTESLCFRCDPGLVSVLLGVTDQCLPGVLMGIERHVSSEMRERPDSLAQRE